MKRLLTLFTFILVTFTINAQLCPDENHPHAIDLGLPSGTKWACCNVGADKPEDFGGYYAWGETEEKTAYDWSTYTHCDGTQETCHNLGEDIAGTQYDVAHVKWGGSWIMPSLDQMIELLTNSTYGWVTLNDVVGAQLTGNNGESIFLPATGEYMNSAINDAGSIGYYWLSRYSEVDSAQACFFLFKVMFWDAENYNGRVNRQCGRTVRPVISINNNINHPKSSFDISNQAIYNLYGIKVSNSTADMNTLPPGIYIVNGKKMVIK